MRERAYFSTTDYRATFEGRAPSSPAFRRARSPLSSRALVAQREHSVSETLPANEPCAIVCAIKVIKRLQVEKWAFGVHSARSAMNRFSTLYVALSLHAYVFLCVRWETTKSRCGLGAFHVKYQARKTRSSDAAPTRADARTEQHSSGTLGRVLKQGHAFSVARDLARLENRLLMIVFFSLPSQLNACDSCCVVRLVKRLSHTQPSKFDTTKGPDVLPAFHVVFIFRSARFRCRFLTNARLG